MEKDTVLLAVEKYNELRDFKKEVEESLKESKFAVIEERWGDFVVYGYSRKYYTENEAVLDFETRNKELEAKNKELEAKIEKAGIKEPVEKYSGLTKREYFAGKALQGLLSIYDDNEQDPTVPNEENVKYMAKLAVKAADSLLDALS